MYLEKINEPSEIKKLNLEELTILSNEVRKALINKISKSGGHKGPNLGVVEMSVALHYVFDSPKDKFVFDVSHQCYPHKILTGRKHAFLDDEHFGDVTGYTNPLESEHDIFTIGHTSTSISLALGLAKGRDLLKKDENIIAIIGDGSLSGGQALEAIDYAGEYNKNLIIIINDNDQSIAENHGGLYKTLKTLRQTNGKSENNIFKSFGLDYKYLDDGHNIKKLVELFESVKSIDHPIVLHIHTIKGKGLKYAEENKENWHAGGPFNLDDGLPKFPNKNNNTTVHDSLVELLESNKKAILVTASTPMGLGFTKNIRPKYEKTGQLIDVGCAEENAVSIISGIAKNGGTPVFGTFAPFFQRTYDQISHDLCLNNNPAVMLVLLAGVYGMTSNTHACMTDISMLSHIPNLIYLAPTSKEEYMQMFKFATTQKQNPIAIRVPVIMPETKIKDTTDYSIQNKSEIVINGKNIAIIGVSNMLQMAKDIAQKVKEETGKQITIINPKFLTGIDKELLGEIQINHQLVITLEDNFLDGGYGQRISNFYGESNIKVRNFGISKQFHTDFDPQKLLEHHGMSVDKLVSYIKLNLK